MKDSFGARLRFFRSKAGLSQQQLADKTGLSRKIISDYEVKLDVMPRETNLYKIADALDVDSSNLVPKSEVDLNNKNPDGDIEFKMNINELPKHVVLQLRELAKHNNRSVHDELEHVMHKAISEAIDRAERGEKEDSSSFENSKTFKLEESFLCHLKNS